VSGIRANEIQPNQRIDCRLLRWVPYVYGMQRISLSPFLLQALYSCLTG